MSYWERTKSYTATSFRALSEAAFEYDTPKIVHIKNKKVGMVNRLVQLIIVGYIVGFAIVYQQGYNEFEDVLSTVTTKVQGLGYTNGTGIFENAGYRVWDSSDYVIPPQSPNSVFIMTNMWVTNQTQGVCPETHYKNCSTDDDCEFGYNTGNGILNGTCNATPPSNGSCLALAWCPIEKEDKSITRNVGENIKDGCRFEFSGENYFCPIISVRQIIDMLEHNYNFNDLAVNGSVLGLQIKWDCDLNRAPENCEPVYSARRLDDPHAQFSSGFNFRFATSWIFENGTMGRQLIKAYGIRINVLVTGQGGKFSFTNLILAIGSGIALLAVATVVSDIFVLYVLRQRDYYRKKKYQNVEGGASFFREDTVVVDPKELPAKETDPLLGSQVTDGETSDDASTSVNLRQKNHHRRHS